MKRCLFVLSAMIFLTTPAFATDKAPGFTTFDTAGNELVLAELLEQNELVVLNFWIAGCQPCYDLVAYTDAFQHEYAADGLASYVVYDYCELGAEAGEEFFKATGITLPVIEDCTGELSDLFGVCAYPHLFIIGKDGVILWDDCGYLCGDEICIQALIHEYLRGVELEWDEIVELK